MKAARPVVLLTLAALVASAAAHNEVIEKPECDGSKNVTIRYAGSTERLYLEAAVSGQRGGCVALTDIFNDRAGRGPLYPVDPQTGARVGYVTGTWLLTEDLYVQDGITLNVSRGSKPREVIDLPVRSDREELRV